MTYMTYKSTIRIIRFSFIFQLQLTLTFAHLEMSWPYPLRSKLNPLTPESLIDYSMTSPLEASGANVRKIAFANAHSANIYRSILARGTR